VAKDRHGYRYGSRSTDLDLDLEKPEPGVQVYTLPANPWVKYGMNLWVRVAAQRWLSTKSIKIKIKSALYCSLANPKSTINKIS
jgi:hypothetical protein